MGLAIKETLPKRAQRSIQRDRMQDVREIIPIRMTACRKITFIPKKGYIPTRQSLYWLAALLPDQRLAGFNAPGRLGG